MKNLGKIKATIIAACIAVVMVIGLLATFVPMHIGSKDFESVIGSMSLSRGMGDGISAEYIIDGEYTDEEISKAIRVMANITSEYGFKSVSIYKKGEDRIRLDISTTVLESNKAQAEEFLTTLASGKLEFKNVNKADATSETNIVIDGANHIEAIEKVSYKTSAGLKIKFTKEGKELYSQSTGAPLYMFKGGEAWPGANNQNEIAANTDPSATEMFLMFNSPEVVDTYYYTLRAGMIPVSFEADSVDVVYTSSKVAGVSNIILLVLTFVIFAALSTLLIIRFKLMGAAATVASIIALMLELFILQAMNWVVIGVASMIAIIFMLIINYSAIVILLNKIIEQNKVGKTPSASVEDGFNKSAKAVSLIYATTLVIGIFFAFIGKVELCAIGTILSLGSIFLALATIFLTRLIINVIYSFYPTKAQIFNLSEREDA